MFRVLHLSADRGRLNTDPRSRLVDGSRLVVFSWAAAHDRVGAKQTAYRLQLQGGPFRCDTGWVESALQEAVADAVLPEAEPLRVTLALRDDEGRESVPFTTDITNAHTLWNAGWITLPGAPDRVIRLRRRFTPRGAVRRASLYACGLGYQKLLMNDAPLDDAWLDPAHTDYTKTCRYVFYGELPLRDGENTLEALVGAGWRHNCLTGSDAVRFDGETQFSAMLRIEYTNGERECIATGSDWEAAYGPWVSADLFDGACYDASAESVWRPAVSCPAPGGAMRPMLLEPIREQRRVRPVAFWPLGDAAVYDLGQNLAGVVCLKLPRGLRKGQRITLTHAEELTAEGDLYTAPLRAAKAQDTYIASGDGRDLSEFTPIFTYHGFRYLKVEGLGAIPDADSVCAIELHTAMDSASFFRCGDALATRIHELCVATERANQHSILTDCPQRDERQGWMNDATVRFEETPYNFAIGRMFPKIVRDLIDVQSPDGAITCTAPYVFGNRPADPVCSSFLIAGYEAWLHGGDTSILREGYPAWCAWENYLLAHSEDLIVNYGYYGDWAAPEYACVLNSLGDGAESAVTPKEFMSTGFSYRNCVLLTEFADALGLADDARKWRATAGQIREAMLAKWYDPASGRIGTGSQACMAFALKLSILPEADRAAIAKALRDDLVSHDYRFTTGNLCTRYLMDVLTEYGYVDDAWALLTKQTYPSYGFMLQQEATTVWERFELKKEPGMNSHDHPMYGAVDYWFYAYLCGLQPLEPGWRRFRVQPYFPKGLYSAQATVDTAMGSVCVRWVKRYGACTLHITVPFGTTAEVVFGGETHTVSSGFHVFSVPCGD